MLAGCFDMFGEVYRALGNFKRVLGKNRLCDVFFYNRFEQSSLFCRAGLDYHTLAAQRKNLLCQLFLFFLKLRFTRLFLRLDFFYFFFCCRFGQPLWKKEVARVPVGNLFDLAVLPHPAYIFEQYDFHMKIIAA